MPLFENPGHGRDVKRFSKWSIGLVLPLASTLGVATATARPTSSDYGKPSVYGQPSIYGQWRTDDGAGIVDIEPCGSSICGTLVRVLDPKAPERDINNPDPTLRKHTLVGTRILSGLKRAGDIWKGGEAYDPKAGRSYKASVALASPSQLDVTGCLLFLCKTKHWTRPSQKADQ